MRDPNILRTARFAAGLTVSSAAAMLNVDTAEIVNWEVSGVMSDDPQKEADRYSILCRAMDSRVGGIVRGLSEKPGSETAAKFTDWVIEIAGLMGLDDTGISAVGQRIVDRARLVRQRPALPDFAGPRLVEEFPLESVMLSVELSSIQRKKVKNCISFEQLCQVGLAFKSAITKSGLPTEECIGVTLTYWGIENDYIDEKKQCNCTAVSYVFDGNSVVVTALNRVIKHLQPGSVEMYLVSAQGFSEEWKRNLEREVQSYLK